MQEVSAKESGLSSTHSISNGGVNCQLWWNSTSSLAQQSSLSKSVSLNMDSSHQDCHIEKQIGFQLQDQDSSSTQSTGQSHHEMTSMRGGNHNGKRVSVQPEYDEAYGKQVEADHIKSGLSLSTSEIVFPPSHVDYCQAVARVPYPYVDPYYGGLVTAYGPQAMIHPQMMGVTPARVPLPLDLAEVEPTYVNPKQYRGILRRRQSRAKLEAQNKLIKDRKPYLHESRHLHALKRARGSGGRFLNTKSLPDSKRSPNSDCHNTSNSAFLQLSRNISESEIGNTGASTTSCSDITTASNSNDMLRQQDFRYSGYTHMGGPQHRVHVSQ